MKKLTAGIFATILGLTAMGAADAAVTSKAYVDAAVATKVDTTTYEAGQAAQDAKITALENANNNLDNTYVTEQELEDSQTAQDSANAAKYETIANVTTGLAAKVDTTTYEAGQAAQDAKITALETNSATKAELTTEATTRETKDNELQAAIEAIEGGFTDAEVSMDGVYALTMKKVGDDVTYYWEYIDRTYAADDLVSGTNPDSAEAEATQPQP